jgi:RES domain-containing protein
LHQALYFGLEKLRQQHSVPLLAALSAQVLNEFELEHWSRIVDYQYSLTPLSVAGSLTSIGGRFNIGHDLNRATFSGFPALYIADSYEAAYLEKFGAPGSGKARLSGAEFALRSPSSFSQVQIRGRLDQVIDLGNLNSLKPFVDILRGFSMPSDVKRLARQLNLSTVPWLVRSATILQRQLLHPAWRMLPMQFDLPSNSQIFGRIAEASGIHGILFPSSKDSAHRCLALFPQNWAGSSSFIEVADTAPTSARLIRLDGLSTQLV